MTYWKKWNLENCHWTQGPWLAASAISSVGGLPIVAPSAMGRCIASVTVMPREMEGSEDFNRESQANAYVQAASTELYEALSELLDSIAADQERLRPFVPPTTTNTINRCEHALALARGELTYEDYN